MSGQGVEVDGAKIEDVKCSPVPQSKHELKSFIGLATYYKRFVKGFAEIAAPLFRLTGDVAFELDDLCLTPEARAL